MQFYVDVRKIPLQSGELSSEPKKKKEVPGLWHTSHIV